MRTNEQPITVKELAGIFKGWLMETAKQELEKRVQGSQDLQEELEALVPIDEEKDSVVRKVRAQRFREALGGMERLLIGQQEIRYASVLDHILHNIGSSLQALGLLMPSGGLLHAPQLNYRSLSTFPAMVAPRRYLALPTLSKVMSRLSLGREWKRGTTVYLVEYREWQPRFLSLPAHDDERYGLFAWNQLHHKDVYFFPMNPVPGSISMGINEVVMLGPRPSLLSRLFDSNPHRQEQIIRLSAREFTFLLRAFLLDYEQHHTRRQREVAEQDQLGALLWDFLSREE